MTAVFLILFFGGLIFVGMPIAASILVSATSIPLLMGADSPLSWLQLASESINGAVANNVGLTIVLFMVAGEFMAKGKLTEKIFDTFAYFFGKKKGFMPIVSIITCMFYGAISGSGPATTAAVGAMCYPLLISMGYDKFFSASILVSAGCLGMVIPPSVPLTGAAALAGGLELVPLYMIAAVGGVAAGILLIIYAYIHCHATGDGDQALINASVDKLREQSFGALLKDSIWALLTPVLILGTIFSGIADTAQAAVLSLLYSILVAVFIYRTIKVEEILPMIRKCVMNAAPLCFLIALSNVFSAAMRALNIPAMLANALINSGVSSKVLILLVLGCMLLLGAFMDCGAAMTILVPLFAPVIISFGMDPYTAIVAIIMCQAVGLCSPLCGLCMFTMCPIVGCTIGDLGKHVVKLSALIVLVAVIMVLAPGLFSWATAGAFIPAA
jgi:C4-dicarboxylate transporter DctM subunit